MKIFLKLLIYHNTLLLAFSNFCRQRSIILFFCSTTRRWQYENCNKASIWSTIAKSTKIGLKETERNKASTCIIRKKLFELVRTWWSYDVHPSEFAIHSGGCKVRVDNKTIYAFRTDLPVQSSKLVSYALAQLIWCSYFI